jgi:drug/metabolite transporter (DMT)-like permease
VHTHVRLIGILWLAMAALDVLGGAVLLIVANTLFGHSSEYGAIRAPGFLQPLLSFVAIFILAKACLGFLAGWGLLQQQRWARALALVAAFLSLFHIPLGTALGIYTLWTLLPAESEQEYEQLAMVARPI